MIGKTVSHYKIIEKLGEGGMGVVYKAEDTKLQRFVAIKVLPAQMTTDEEAKTRFVREARAASALEHPNICHIHEIGETPDGHLYMVMPCYEGETLRERLERGSLEIGETLDIITQVTSALSRAHEKGIVHRDIKPGNVMLTDSGRQATLMDFGLAKKLDATKVTRTGTAIGTVAYMSPEQALGKEADQRADIWSLGVVLYEMLAGRLPFEGEYEPAVLYSIMNEEPEPVTSVRREVPPGVEGIVERALTKDVAKRYQTTAELLADLEEQRDRLELGIKQRRFIKIRKRTRQRLLRVGLPAILVAVAAFVLLVVQPFELEIRPRTKEAIAQENSMAIMFFENMADPADEGNIAPIVTSALNTDLGESEYIRVLSEQRQHDILKELGKEDLKLLDRSVAAEVAKRAGVNWIVTGKILRLEPNYVLTSEITHALTGELRNTQRVQGEAGEDLFNVIDKLTTEIRMDLSLPEEAGEEPDRAVADITTQSMEAYRYYLEGMEQYYEYNWDQAIASFSKALEYDSTFAQAYFRQAMVKTILGDPATQEEWEKAVQYLDGVPEMERQFIEIFAGEEVDISGLERLAVDFPEEKELHYWLGIAYFWRLRQTEKSLEHFERALELDQNYITALADIVAPYHAAGDFEKALWAVNQSKRMAPDDALPYYSGGLTYGLMGDLDKAIGDFEKALEMDSNFIFAYENLGLVYLLKEDYAKADLYFQKLSSSPATYYQSLGRCYRSYIPLYQGKLDDAFDVLARAIAEDRKEQTIDAATSKKYLLRAVIYREKKSLNMALEEMDKAIDVMRKAYPGDRGMIEIRNRHFQVQLLAENGDFAQAQDIADSVKACLEELELFAVGSNYWYAVGVIEYARGNLEASIAALEKTVGIDWMDSWPRYTLGEVYLAANRLDEAVSILEKAVSMCGQYSITNPVLKVKAHYLLGLAYEKSGSRDKAIAEYEKFLRIWKDADPDLEDVAEARQRLNRLKGID